MQKAFSLVELSIVLVILGLLVGGILAGKSLVKASELRKVINDLHDYRTAMYSFRDKYFYWPGDMPNATSFWGSSVYNGNGNAIIEDANASANAQGENLGAWQHLQAAGLIKGAFTGANASATPRLRPGVNMP